MPCPLLRYEEPADFEPLARRLRGRDAVDDGVEKTVRDIFDAVKTRGDAALTEFTRRFDCPDFESAALTVTAEETDTAMAVVPPADLDILAEAARNIRAFHETQKETSRLLTNPDGTVLGQLVAPVDAAGLYVPGGRGGETPLVSSLLMNAIPAQVAGVARIAVVSPPRRDGTLNPYILAAAALLGLTEVHKVGSAWAVAALAFGTERVAPVDVIAGPGNIFVATAKRLLIGQVGIDMIAGPSEILIIADASANPDWLAADMLSQAEHDPLASALCLTPDPELAGQVLSALASRLAALPRNDIAREALANFGAIMVVPDLDTAAALANRVAPEHLELAVADPWPLACKIRHAGAMFLGHGSPEPVGDYFAGPNHVLPTMGTARFSSALSVAAFTKKTSLIATSPAFIASHADKIARLARLEGLEAHALSVECRKKGE